MNTKIVFVLIVTFTFVIHDLNGSPIPDSNPGDDDVVGDLTENTNESQAAIGECVDNCGIEQINNNNVDNSVSQSDTDTSSGVEVPSSPSFFDGQGDSPVSGDSDNSDLTENTNDSQAAIGDCVENCVIEQINNNNVDNSISQSDTDPSSGVEVPSSQSFFDGQGDSSFSGDSDNSDLTENTNESQAAIGECVDNCEIEQINNNNVDNSISQTDNGYAINQYDGNDLDTQNVADGFTQIGDNDQFYGSDLTGNFGCNAGNNAGKKRPMKKGGGNQGYNQEGGDSSFYQNPFNVGSQDGVAEAFASAF